MALMRPMGEADCARTRLVNYLVLQGRKGKLTRPQRTKITAMVDELLDCYEAELVRRSRNRQRKRERNASSN
jgi:hypothetical protein